MKNNNKTKKTSQVFVVSIMCTVLVSIVWQSLNVAINPNPQNSAQASREPQVHGVAWLESPSSLTNDMNTSVSKQKDQVNQWIKKMFAKKKLQILGGWRNSKAERKRKNGMRWGTLVSDARRVCLNDGKTRAGM